jgi:hypothetical protein
MMINYYDMIPIMSGIKILRVPNRGKTWHPAHLLKPYRRGPKKALTACQLLKARTTNSISPEPREEASGTIGISPEPKPPQHHQKRLTPRGVFPSRPRGMWNPQERRGAMRPPTTVLAPIDVMDVTMHSQQEHGNHVLTRYDSGHSPMMTSIPQQQ